MFTLMFLLFVTFVFMLILRDESDEVQPPVIIGKKQMRRNMILEGSYDTSCYTVKRRAAKDENRRKFISVLDEAITESISYDSPLGLFCAAVLDDLTDNLGST